MGQDALWVRAGRKKNVRRHGRGVGASATPDRAIIDPRTLPRDGAGMTSAASGIDPRFPNLAPEVVAGYVNAPPTMVRVARRFLEKSR